MIELDYQVRRANDGSLRTLRVLSIAPRGGKVFAARHVGALLGLPLAARVFYELGLASGSRHATVGAVALAVVM